MARDTQFLPEMVFVHHLGATLCTFAGIAFIGWLWHRALTPRPVASRHPWIALILIAGFCTLGIRGSIDRKPINSVDAYRYQSFALGNLSLNGVFTATRAMLNMDRQVNNPLTREEAFAELRIDPDVTYPALKSLPASRPSRRNVIVMLLESYEQFYASTQRTIGGIQALLTGVPCVPGLPELSRGLEHTNTTKIALLAKAHGYHTIFIQALRRTSYYLDSVMAALGFDEIYGKTDIPLLRDYGNQFAKWGWDYDTLQFAVDRLSAIPEPFLAVIMTGTTHSPYIDPGDEFRVAEPQAHGEGGYLNTLVYADWAIGRFFDRARKNRWYDRAVFLTGSDHVHRVLRTDLPEAFHIPFLIHGPGIEPTRVRGIYSQLDVLPTLMELMGLPDSYASFGASLMEPSPGMALVKQGDWLGLITDWGWISHTIEKRLEAKITAPDVPKSWLKELERRLLAFHKVTNDLVLSNRWAPPGGR